MDVYIRARTDADNDDKSQGWVVLRAHDTDDLPTVLCFCWNNEYATSIYEALGRQEKGRVWISEATIDESR